MKLFRYLQNGHIKTGAELDGVFYDTSALNEDYDERFFTTYGIKRLKDFLLSGKDSLPKLGADIAYTTPFARPSKIICIGLNYADHAKETGATPPPEPVIFMKATTALVGPYDDVVIPKGSEKTDWEVELAVLIGKKASYVSEEEAADHIAGYCLHNDVSERAFQLERSGTWDKGKGCDSFAPMGPWLVTPDEIADIENVRLWLTLNGETMQDGNSSNLIFKIPFLVSYVSQFMTLLPGDVISTGTPAGVGMGFKPSIYLKPGDVMALGIDGLGEQKQTVRAYGATV
jgi:2-keto-4-pentenoate hydratase/2-oxohepta-3-ene-1,7-dioic acid hydratase in catechol pathway